MITLCKNIPRIEISEKIKKDFPESDVVYLDDTIKDVSLIIQELQAVSLFENERVIVLSDIPRDFWDEIVVALASIPVTTQIFWREDSFLAAMLKKMPEHQVWESSTKKELGVNPFMLANSLATGDGKKIWMDYQILLDQGIPPEELFGILWWKLKDIAKKQSNISPSLQKTFHRFLSTYSSARESGGDLTLELEQLLLSLTKKDLV